MVKNRAAAGGSQICKSNVTITPPVALNLQKNTKRWLWFVSLQNPAAQRKQRVFFASLMFFGGAEKNFWVWFAWISEDIISGWRTAGMQPFCWCSFEAVPLLPFFFGRSSAVAPLQLLFWDPKLRGVFLLNCFSGETAFQKMSENFRFWPKTS